MSTPLPCEEEGLVYAVEDIDEEVDIGGGVNLRARELAIDEENPLGWDWRARRSNSRNRSEISISHIPSDGLDCIIFVGPPYVLIRQIIIPMILRECRSIISICSALGGLRISIDSGWIADDEQGTHHESKETELSARNAHRSLSHTHTHAWLLFTACR